ncbi:MAG TPA: DMT family transporter [Bacillota bacterium]|nr:DMT family transporter [Bacillota bacterium]
MGELSRVKTASLITFLVLTWGLCWPIFKIALPYTPPILFAGMRTLFGGLLLAAILLPKWRQIHFLEKWPIYFISALFNGALFYGIQTVGLNYLPAGLFSVIVYIQPVLVGIFAWIWLGEAMSFIKIIGLIFGFLGVCAVSADGFKGHISLLGIVLAMITGASWALGTIYVKRVGSKVDSGWLVALQCIIAGLFLTGIGSVTEKWSNIVWSTPYLFGLLFGSILGISAAWVVFFKLVYSGDASKVASFTFLVPLIAVSISTLYLNEPFTISLFVGLILIVTSIYLVNRKPKQIGSNQKLKPANKIG